ncbi:hypothetical protein BHE74_00039017 [Ensete ventricosum]|nr:hypothetical protein BHE74_00039017 [Ensete ventricosum]
MSLPRHCRCFPGRRPRVAHRSPPAGRSQVAARRSPARCRRPWVARAPSSLSPAFSPARGERSRRRFLIVKS